MLVRVPELEIISAYLPKYTSFVLIKITKTRYTNNNTHLNNKNIKICDLNPIFQKKIVFRKNRTPHCWVLLVFCNLYLQFIAPINLRNKCIDLSLVSKYLCVLFLMSLRLPRSNILGTQKDKNSKWKVVKARWNPKFGLSDLENDLLTSTTTERAQWLYYFFNIKTGFWAN